MAKKNSSLSKKEVDLLLSILEAESIKLDSIKTIKENQNNLEPRQTLNSLKDKLPQLL